MQEEFVKEVKLKEKTDEELSLDLIKSIIKTKNDLNNLNKNFEFAEDELIDFYLYQIKANQSKLNYLLKKAKKEGIVLDRVNEIEIRKKQYNANLKVV